MVSHSFPRGGKKPLSKKSTTNSLFHQKVKSRSQKKKSEKSKVVHKQLNTEKFAKAECLTYTTLSQGMILLGRVHSSTQYDVTITLPGRLSGFLQVTDISEAYTNLLRNLVSSEDAPKEFKPLSELFKRGNYVVCYVKSVNAGDKRRVILSVEPDVINQNFDYTKLKKGSTIACSVHSIEDHGYVMDIGNKNVRGFLPTSDVHTGAKYYPGQQIFCSIRSVTTTENMATVKLSTKPDHLKAPLSSAIQPLDTLVPGSNHCVTIKKVLSDGLQVTFNGDNIGYINRLYLQNSLDAYEAGVELSSTFLYTIPIVKFSYFTEIPLESEEKALKIGDLEKGTVLYHCPKGIVLTAKSCLAFLPFKRTGIDFQRIPEKFAPGSIHKCRILTYDIFDRVYICTVLKQELTPDHKIPETIVLGDILTVQIIRQSDNKYLFVKAKKILGDVSPEHIRDIDDSDFPAINSKVSARVLSRDKTGERFNFTLKKSLINSELPILSELSEAKIGSTYLGTIIGKSGQGLLLKFYGDLKGVISSKALQNVRGGIKAFRVGQVVHVKVANINFAEQKLALDLVTDDAASTHIILPFNIGEKVEGTVTDSSPAGVHVEISHSLGIVNAFLPAGHMSPCHKIGEHMAAISVPGDKISASVFCTTPEFLLTKNLNPQEWYADFKNLSIGDCIPCSISQIMPMGIKVLLPVKGIKNYGILASNKIDDIKVLYKHQMLFGKITQLNKRTEVIQLTAILHEVWSAAITNNADVYAPLDLLASYVSTLKELSSHSYYQNKPISTMKLGQRVSGIVETLTKKGAVVRLTNNVPGTVRSVHMKKKVKIGDNVEGTVLWVDYRDELVELTLNPTLMNAIKPKQDEMTEDTFLKNLKGEIVLVDPWFILAVVRGHGKGRLVALPTRAHVNDVKPHVTKFHIGAKIRCHILMNAKESGILPIAFRKEAFVAAKGHPSTVKAEIKEEDIKIEDTTEDETANEKTTNKRKGDDQHRSDQSTANKRRKANLIDESVDHIATDTDEEKDAEHEVEVVEETVPKLKKKQKERRMSRSSTESKDKEDSKVSELENLTIPDCGFFWDTNPDLSLLKADSSDNEEEPEGPKRKKQKKLNSAERRELERQKEREIREKEEALASNRVPNSIDQFDRLVMASPDSSLVWLQYMAYHLQSTEIEKARSVATRALKTINFREENEKLNIWQGWLNLESRFGSPESLSNVFHEALKANDVQKVYLHMLKIHADAGRIAEVENIVKTITAKFKNLPDIWKECGSELLKIGLKEKSRHTMQRALQSLPPAHHVQVMVKFAQLENKLGDVERARTLFEQILTSYPKRVDIWSIYIDTLIKSKDYDSARKTLERAVHQVLPVKKMKTLFKKFIDFEDQYGTQESVRHARELAVKYVENQCNGK